MNKSTVILNAARVITVLMLVGAAIYYFASGHEFSVEAVPGYTPESYPLATLFIMACIASCLVAGSSCLIYYFMTKNKENHNAD